MVVRLEKRLASLVLAVDRIDLAQSPFSNRPLRIGDAAVLCLAASLRVELCARRLFAVDCSDVLLALGLHLVEFGALCLEGGNDIRVGADGATEGEVLVLLGNATAGKPARHRLRHLAVLDGTSRLRLVELLNLALCGLSGNAQLSHILSAEADVSVELAHAGLGALDRTCRVL